MQPEQTYEKGLFEGLQGWMILSVASALPTAGPTRCGDFPPPGLLRWPEWPTKPGPKFAPKLYKNNPEICAEICTEIHPKNLGLFLQYEKIPSHFWSPPGKPLTHHFGNLIWGDFVHNAALVCLLCLTFFLGNKLCIIETCRTSTP